MRCDDALALMMSLLDGGVRQDALERHLDECGGCRGEWEALLASETMLRSEWAVDPPRGFADGVLARIAAESNGPLLRAHPLAHVALALCGGAALVSALAVALGAFPAISSDARTAALAEGVVRGLALSWGALLVQSGRDAAQVALYTFAAAAMAVGWFGALVVPRHAASTVVLDE